LFSKSYVAAGGVPLAVTESRQGKRGLGVWQPRFWEHRIRDEAELYRYRDYIHLNPVTHAYVAAPEDWPWSSFHRHVQLGWLDPKWPGSSAIEIEDVPGE
jgi:putative transposase